MPTLFNVKVRNFFYATLIGIIPQIFIVVSIGSGLEKVIDQNLTQPKFSEIILDPNIYMPLIVFFSLVILTIIIRKFFYKK